MLSSNSIGCHFNTWGCGPLLTPTGVILTPQFLQTHRKSDSKPRKSGTSQWRRFHVGTIGVVGLIWVLCPPVKFFKVHPLEHAGKTHLDKLLRICQIRYEDNSGISGRMRNASGLGLGVKFAKLRPRPTRMYKGGRGVHVSSHFLGKGVFLGRLFRENFSRENLTRGCF